MAESSLTQPPVPRYNHNENSRTPVIRPQPQRRKNQNTTPKPASNMEGEHIQIPVSPKVKPALKHPAKTDSAAPVDLDTKGKHLTWDERAIEEHDVLRGTRMKIDEPNTPYTHYDHSDDDQSTSSGRNPRSPDEKNAHHAPPLQWNALESKLQVVADKRDACPLSPAHSRDGASDSEGEAEIKRRKAKQEEHDKAFRDHRKKHYNEAEAMKRWKAEHMDDSDEDDSDGELNGNK